jgi:hypothetical protein
MKYATLGFLTLCFAASTIAARANLTFDVPDGWRAQEVRSKTIQIDARAKGKLVALYVPEVVKKADDIFETYSIKYPYLAIYAYDDTETYDRRIDYFRQHMSDTANWGTSGGHADRRRVTADDEVPICNGTATAHRFKYVETNYTTSFAYAVEEVYVDNGPQRYTGVYSRPATEPEDAAAALALRSICPAPVVRIAPK